MTRASAAVATTTGTVIPPGNHQDGDSSDERDWQVLKRSEWDSNASAYRMALAAMRIIAGRDLTLAAFAAECKQRGVRGWGSQVRYRGGSGGPCCMTICGRRGCAQKTPPNHGGRPRKGPCGPKAGQELAQAITSADPDGWSAPFAASYHELRASARGRAGKQ